MILEFSFFGPRKLNHSLDLLYGIEIFRPDDLVGYDSLFTQLTVIRPDRTTYWHGEEIIYMSKEDGDRTYHYRLVPAFEGYLFGEAVSFKLKERI